jgi:two-component system CheB/CheR fusion protein
MADNDNGPMQREPLAGESSAKPVIVGIGASAGGIQALQSLFDALPDATGAAFVVVVHLDPDSHSELARILAARTRMPVLQVEVADKLQANQVYVIPPRRQLQISDHEVSAAEFDDYGKRFFRDIR